MNTTKLAIVALVAIAFQAMSSSVLAGGRLGEDTAEKARLKVSKLGTGPKSRVEVKTLDGKKLKGYISEIKDGGFVVVDKDGNATEIAYTQTRQVSNRTKTIVAIVVGVTLVVIVAIMAAKST